MIQLLFSSNNTLPSLFIRLVTWSKWSHVDIITPEGTLIGALARKGVVDYPIMERLSDSTRYEVRLIEGDAAIAVGYGRSQIGKRYDWMGLLGVRFGKYWQKATRWFCSELAAHAAIVAGNTTIKRDVYRVTPGSLYRRTVAFVNQK